MGGRSDQGSGEAGFTILESTIALSLVFATLVGLLGALTAGTRGLVTGRQRSAALALANQILESARGRAYGDVGHDFDSDPTLATDPAITGTAPNLIYKSEPLAASAVDAGGSGGTVTNPLFPFSPHKFTSKREQTTYTTFVYVTTVTPASGDAYKRITAIISWSPAQYANAAKSVTLSSFLFNAGAPPDPKLIGNGEADAGTFKVQRLGGRHLAGRCQHHAALRQRRHRLRLRPQRQGSGPQRHQRGQPSGRSPVGLLAARPRIVLRPGPG